ncbi:MAG: hypothetical protein ACRD09_07025, partial [Vicinamibacterales bacterium]
QESLIERARAGARDGKYVLNIDVYSQVFDVPRLTSESELIVHGRIDGDIQMLSPDSRTVITEYDVIPIKLFKNLTPPGSYPPGVPLKVWMPYGTVRLDDVEITINSNDFPAHECLRSGEEAVLFLTTEETDVTRLRLTGGASGAFRVSNGKVRAMTRDTAKRRGDSANIPLASFNAQIEKALAQR